MSVFQMEDADHYRKLEDFPVQKKVHSLAVDTDRTGCTRRSKKRTETRLRGWWFTKQTFIEPGRAQGR
jgi:hypothetical protein